MSAPANDSPAPAEEDAIPEPEEPREMTLKEYRELQSQNKKENNFKIRKAGEGCEKKWGNREGYFLNKANNQKEALVEDEVSITHSVLSIKKNHESNPARLTISRKVPERKRMPSVAISIRSLRVACH